MPADAGTTSVNRTDVYLAVLQRWWASVFRADACGLRTDGGACDWFAAAAGISAAAAAGAGGVLVGRRRRAAGDRRVAAQQYMQVRRV